MIAVNIAEQAIPYRKRDSHLLQFDVNGPIGIVHSFKWCVEHSMPPFSIKRRKQMYFTISFTNVIIRNQESIQITPNHIRNFQHEQELYIFSINL